MLARRVFPSAVGRERGRTDFEDRFLAFDRRRDGVLLDVDYQVASLEIAGYCDGDVDVADGLGPLVGEGVLLGLLLGASRSLFGGS